MNWIERTIAGVSPTWALQRAQARIGLDIARRFEEKRAYEGAKNTRRTENWTAGGSSANAEIAPSLATLRNRARQLIRDNPYASRALAAFAAKCVGTGITARPEDGASKAWTRFTKSCDVEGEHDLAGMQLMAANAAFESGEVLVRRIRTRDLAAPLQLQILEPDYIDSAKFGDYEGNFIIAGVEIDRLGRKQALWLFDRHPGELLGRWSNPYSSRVPMSELIHWYEKTRPGQLRGVPKFASSLLRARDLDEYRDALLVKKKIEACFAVFVVGGGPAVPLGQAKTEPETNRRVETMSPGMIEYLPHSTDVKFASPSSGANESEFTIDELHAIAAGAGITYEQMTGDLRRVNFSSMRAGEINMRELVDVWRWIHFVPRFMERVKDWFEDAYWTAGQLRTTGYEYVWSAPKWQWVDPLKDIKADKEEVRGGMASLSAKIRERGEDPKQVFKELKEERDGLNKDGVVVDTDAAHGVQAKDTADSEPTDGDKGDQGREADALLLGMVRDLVQAPAREAQ